LKQNFVKAILVFTVALACTFSSSAQTVTGSIRGTITDPTGAVVSNATISAKNVATGVTTVATSNQSGQYSIGFLQIGQYKLTITASGFKAATYGPFDLEIDQTAKIDIPLSLGASNTTVEVSDQMQPLLDTESSTLGETISQNAINSLPMNGRDFTQLTVFTPGAIAPGYGSYGGSDSIERSTDQGNEVSVNGNRQESNNFLLDGQEINENLNNTLGYNPSPDALQEIRVITSNANAEFGNVNGGTVLAVMKSGTNKLHGSVYGYFKDYKLDANSWSNDNNLTPLPKNPYTTTQYGATFGGPILKDKLFFFVDYAGVRSHSAGVTTASVAPAAFRTGNLSTVETYLGIQLYDTQTLTAGLPTAYTNNQVPITNPVAIYLFAHPNAYPLPNNPTTDPMGIYNNFIGPTGSFIANDQGDAKINWTIRPSDSASFRYSQGYAQDGQTADPLPVEFPSASNYPDHFFDSNWTHSFSPAIVNNFVASYGRIRFNSGVSVDPSGIFGLNGNSEVGIPGNAQQTAGFSSQNFNGTGGNGYPSGFGSNPTPEIFIDNIFGYSDNLTWQKGKNLFKFGAEFLRYQQNSFYPGNDGELGAFNYDGSFSDSPVATNSGLYPFADFLTDRAQDVQIGAVTGRTGQRQWRDGIYAQDDYKVKKNLTLNIGLRWEFDQPIYEVNNKEANLNLTTLQIEYAGQNGNSRALYNPTYNQFQPRVGFAYQFMPRLVIRGGFGISSYLEGTGANLRLTQNPPYHTDFEEIATAPSYVNSTYSPGVYYKASNGFPTTQVPTTTFYAWPANLKPSVTDEYSLTTEYQLTNKSALQIGYLGIAGHHLTDPFWGNQATSPTAAQPYESIVGINGVLKITETESTSNYNGLQAVYRLHPTNGLELTANYTYSKSLTDDIGFYGDSTANSSGQYYQQNIYDMKSEWGPALTDARHNISVVGVYELPFGHGKMFGSNWNTIVNDIVGDWKLSGTQVYYSGFPVTISSPANYSSLVNAFTGAARPEQLEPMKIVNRSINAYFGTAVQGTSCGPNQNNGTCIYAQQPDNAFGNVRPGSLRADSFQNLDMSLAKSVKIYRENVLELRADFFNAFNIASYAQPDSGVTDSNFGQITGTNNGNRSTQLSLKYSF